ncbi:hypothetical protein MMC24_000854 [Lignoscripta atroalba]|nr:hypothetical protein [Lignoscripta atroalba]
MSLDEKSVVGAQVISIDPPAASTPDRPRLTLLGASPNTLDLTPTASQCPTPMEEYDPTSTHPFSAFYSHPTTRTSFEQLKSESKINIKIYEQDLEAGTRAQPSLDASRSTNKECKVWPGKHQLIQKEIEMKRRGCRPWSLLTNKQKVWAKILIALLIVGTAVGVGIGISKTVGGGVWKNVNSQSRIGDGSD